MTALQTLGQFLAADLQVTPATRPLATRLITDMVGAWIAGSGTPEGKRLRAWRASVGGDSLADDVALACALARSSEIDNIHLESSTTPGGIVVPAALTIAARIGADGATVAAAVFAGVEAMVRLGAAIGGPTVLYRGIWPTYFAAPFGVTAVAARLHGLDADQTAHALALALTVASPGVGHHNAASTSRWFAVAQMARAGVVAADAARAGFTSDLKLLDGNFLSGVYGITPDLAAFTAALGEPLALERCSFKPWCAARQTMAATQALKEILAGGVTADEITAVEARVPPAYHKMVDHGVSVGDRASFLTSLPYHLAIAALDPEAEFDIGSSPAQVAPPIEAFMAKVTVAADESLLPHYPRAWPAELTVRTGAGAARVKRVLHVPGDPERPLLDGQLDAKFRRVVRPLVGAVTDGLWKACRTVLDTGAVAGLVTDVTRLIERAR